MKILNILHKLIARIPSLLDRCITAPHRWTLPNEHFITSCYQGLLGRHPSPPELRGYLASMALGKSERDILEAFIHSDEFSVRQQRLTVPADDPGTPAAYFVHIPKTAGMSVKRWIAHSAESVGGRMFPGAFMADLFLFADARSYTHYAGHFGGFLQPFLARPTRTAVLLRDPVERVISHHAHGLRDPSLPLHALIDGRSLDEALLDPATSGYVQNYQAKFLASLDYGRYLLPHTRAAQSLMAKYRRRPAACRTARAGRHRYRWCLRRAAHLSGPPRRRLEHARLPSPTPANIGYNRPREQLQPDVKQRLQALNAVDYALYDYAATRARQRDRAR
ncbi:DUF4214 domain-containing protein [uncultured Thiohalocapsa sp.]|uniref:DUF4214 domain-containing protein n=1 Tax=uncultured Thiohalocapsa sp. TaxID=768990 RepID=UPI0025E109FD|nr:DUF4214 domain-containing protein [uncultured Thiohalocapsa sp.]